MQTKMFDGAEVPVKMWTDGVPVEEAAEKQLANLARMPFMHKHIAVMPDVHWGMGATVGSVIATKGAIIPAAVGVDIGCGMVARKTTLTASDLPDNLFAIRTAIEAAVPHGRTDNGGANDIGSWRGNVPESVGIAWYGLEGRLVLIAKKHQKIGGGNTINHLGTLGGGNHFIELCLDEGQNVWVMLHSGSRGIGNKIGQYFINKAKEEMKRYFITLPDVDLAYLSEGTDYYLDYCEAVAWAQDFARVSRELMMFHVLTALADSSLGLPKFSADLMAVNCHHNYVSKETHFGADVTVTRKGAVRAGLGDLGIIPGSMGARSFIVRGKGNRESFSSCSHGAGRKMSRAAANKTFTIEDHIKATAGIECRKDADVIDETPGAYKDIDAVMAAQADLVDIVHTLRQVVCVKG